MLVDERRGPQVEEERCLIADARLVQPVCDIYIYCRGK